MQPISPSLGSTTVPVYYEEPSGNPRLPHRRFGVLLSVALWLMVWGGYNTGIERLFAPGFPEGPLDLFHGLRTFLPFMAAYLAGIMLLARRSLPRAAFVGPLGLLALYTLVGVMATALGRLYSDKEFRLRMGRKARERAEREYHWDRLGERLQEIYEEALGLQAG